VVHAVKPYGRKNTRREREYERERERRGSLFTINQSMNKQTFSVFKSNSGAKME